MAAVTLGENRQRVVIQICYYDQRGIQICYYDQRVIQICYYDQRVIQILLFVIKIPNHRPTTTSGQKKKNQLILLYTFQSYVKIIFSW